MDRSSLSQVHWTCSPIGASRRLAAPHPDGRRVSRTVGVNWAAV